MINTRVSALIFFAAYIISSTLSQDIKNTHTMLSNFQEQSNFWVISIIKVKFITLKLIIKDMLFHRLN